MEFTKLTPPDSEKRKNGIFADDLVDQKLTSKYGLLPHTDEELKNIEYKPGLTLEQLQERSRAARDATPGLADSEQLVTVFQADRRQLSDSTVSFDASEAPGEFDHRFDDEVNEARSKQHSRTRSHAPAHHGPHTGHKHHAGCKHGHAHSHGHSHSHAQGHSHSSHGKKDSKFKSQIDRYKVPLRLLIYFIQLTHYLYICLQIAPLYSDPFYTWVTRVVCSFVFGVTFYSHLTVSLSSSLSFDRKKDKAFLSRPPYNTCEKCDSIWKPQRAHHCSVQNHDVLRMDHYCPVTLNTIGYRSHGAFLITAVGHLVDWSILDSLLDLDGPAAAPPGLPLPRSDAREVFEAPAGRSLLAGGLLHGHGALRPGHGHGLLPLGLHPDQQHDARDHAAERPQLLAVPVQ